MKVRLTYYEVEETENSAFFDLVRKSCVGDFEEVRESHRDFTSNWDLIELFLKVGQTYEYHQWKAVGNSLCFIRTEAKIEVV